MTDETTPSDDLAVEADPAVQAAEAAEQTAMATVTKARNDALARKRLADKVAKDAADAAAKAATDKAASDAEAAKVAAAQAQATADAAKVQAAADATAKAALQVQADADAKAESDRVAAEAKAASDKLAADKLASEADAAAKAKQAADAQAVVEAAVTAKVEADRVAAAEAAKVAEVAKQAAAPKVRPWYATGATRIERKFDFAAGGAVETTVREYARMHADLTDAEAAAALKGGPTLQVLVSKYGADTVWQQQAPTTCAASSARTSRSTPCRTTAGIRSTRATATASGSCCPSR